MIDAKAMEELQPHLMLGEKVIWIGESNQGLQRKENLVSTKAVGLFVLTAGVLLVFASSVNPDSAITSLFELAFLGALLPLFLNIWILVKDSYQRKSQIYAVTSSRLIVMRGISIQSSALDVLPQLRMTNLDNGSGTINFSSIRSDNDGGYTDGPENGTSFKYLANANEVFALILRAQKEAMHHGN